MSTMLEQFEEMSAYIQSCKRSIPRIDLGFKKFEPDLYKAAVCNEFLNINAGESQNANNYRGELAKYLFDKMLLIIEMKPTAFQLENLDAYKPMEVSRASKEVLLRFTSDNELYTPHYTHIDYNYKIEKMQAFDLVLDVKRNHGDYDYRYGIIFDPNATANMRIYRRSKFLNEKPGEDVQDSLEENVYFERTATVLIGSSIRHHDLDAFSLLIDRPEINLDAIGEVIKGIYTMPEHLQGTFGTKTEMILYYAYAYKTKVPASVLSSIETLEPDFDTVVELIRNKNKIDAIDIPYEL